MKLGDYVAFSVLAGTLGVEAFILLAAVLFGPRDPFRIRMRELQANLELDKQAKARGRRIQTKGY